MKGNFPLSMAVLWNQTKDKKKKQKKTPQKKPKETGRDFSYCNMNAE